MEAPQIPRWTSLQVASVFLQIAARVPDTAGRVQRKSAGSITGTKLLCMSESCRL